MRRIRLTKEAQETLQLVVKCFMTAVAVIIIANYVLGFCYVRGNYMFPSVRDGDLVISLRLEPITLNDVVVYSVDDSKRIGRVVAKAGDLVDLSEDGELLVNGAVALEEIFYPTFPADGSSIELPYRVPEGKVFILNDYRSLDDPLSKDSRTFGSVAEDKLQGKACLLLRRRGF